MKLEKILEFMRRHQITVQDGLGALKNCAAQWLCILLETNIEHGVLAGIIS